MSGRHRLVHGRHRAPVEHHVGTAVATTGIAAAVGAGSLFLPTAVASASVPVPQQASVQTALPMPAALPSQASYVVASGDTLSGIGARVNEAWRTLYQDNAAVIGPNPDLILPGQALVVGGTATPAPAPAPAPSAAPAATVLKHANITNSAGPVRPVTQAGADAVVTNVAGADQITLGGTRASAIDPHGHPAGLAIDYMVGLGNTALGHAIVDYTVAHWSELHVEYVIYQQHILLSPGGSWQLMEDRGSPTQNHQDHVHVNYVG